MTTNDPEEIVINDEVLVCKHCGFNQFYSSEYNPKTAGFNFPGMEWMNKSVEVFVCGNCGFFHWFASELPTEMPSASRSAEESEVQVVPEKDLEDLDEPSECVSCGKTIPVGYDHCPSCGWTYKESMKEG